MCGIIVMVPIIVAWPVFAAAATSIAVQLGYHTKKKQKSELAEEEKTLQKVEVDVKGSDILSESMSYEETFTIQAGDVDVTFMKTPRGKVKMVVTGDNHSHEELREIGNNILDKVTQQYTLTMVKNELESRGFEINEEANLKDGSIKLNVTRWD